MKKLIVFSLMMLFISASYATPNSITSCAGKQVLGISENIILSNHLKIPAKLDTGAAMSSLSAVNIAQFNKDNKVWLRFNVENTVITAPLQGYVRIISRNEENNQNAYHTRMVIALPICLGQQQQTILINLTDRRNFSYPMLLGVDALKKFNVLVDVEQNQISIPACKS